jgi:ABC-type hemin transport system ATPase subunit
VFVDGKSVPRCRRCRSHAIEFFREARSCPAGAAKSRSRSSRKSAIGSASSANVGLGYLTLDRSADTLSGGEAQRIRLASQIGSGLVGVMYILDEPSIGLHQRDNQRLLDTLVNLRDLGNTVIVVEHDEDAIRQADYVVDLGPAPACTAAASSRRARRRGRGASRFDHRPVLERAARIEVPERAHARPIPNACCA